MKNTDSLAKFKRRFTESQQNESITKFVNQKIDLTMKADKPKEVEIIDGLSMDEWIKKETEKRTPLLWGKKFPEYSPYLCETILGNGLQLVWLCTTDNRPYHWLIRIDSDTNVYNDFDFENILQPIEEECGSCSDDCECRDTEEECKYPIIKWSGGQWGMIVNFGSGETR